MNRTKKILLLVAVSLILVAVPLAARDSMVAVGAQFGFAATGVVVDIDLGGLAIDVGVNYPMGYTYIASALDFPSELLFVDIYTVTADITQAFSLSDNFDLKVGIGALALTNFGPTFGGVAGGTLRAEYWIPNKNTALFFNVSVPLMLYGAAVGSASNAAIYFHPLLPLVGLLTGTVGVLYGF